MRGNTPAYAGKTSGTNSRNHLSWKHPRVCGEDLPSPCSTDAEVETPPRMRGRPHVDTADRVDPGNTPAYAGKTEHHGYAGVSWQKHPRVCGEDLRALNLCLHLPETPPRMRGRLSPPPLAALILRNTPAYAGKTDAGEVWDGLVKKHPRVCGEDASDKKENGPQSETPPRMRGRPETSHTAVQRRGNTPAYAGKTASVALTACRG